MSTELHQILPVESESAKTAKQILEEGIRTFKKGEHFLGYVKTYSPKADAEPDRPSETKYVDDTVMDKLEYITGHLQDYYDVYIQKEEANQRGKADLVVDGKVLLKDVPGTALLGLESRLKNVKNLISGIPTHQPGIEWVVDKDLRADGRVFRSKDVKETAREIRRPAPVVLHKATDKHPAQVEKVEEIVIVGFFETIIHSGAISPAKKSELLSRIDKLILGTIKARQEANKVEVNTKISSKEIFDFLLKD